LTAISAVAVLGAALALDLGVSSWATGPRTKQAKRHFRAQACNHIGPNARKLDRVRCPNTTGATGPRGAVGPPGPNGSGGGGTADIVIPRTSIPFTTNFMTDGGNVQSLAKVGPIHVDGLCRRTFSPGSGGGGAAPSHPDPRLPTAGGESEAQVIVWTESGSLSFRGQVGPREDIPPGPPDYTAEKFGAPPSPGTVQSGRQSGSDQPVSDPVAGEGDHMFVAASNENADERRATDPQTDNPFTPGSRFLGEYPAFQFADGIIGTSEGHMVKAELMGGFDILGVYGECVFAGVVSPLT
jgi:hypothetical protein